MDKAIEIILSKRRDTKNMVIYDPDLTDNRVVPIYVSQASLKAAFGEIPETILITIAKVNA